jgi:hypothetical protein
MLLRVAQEMIPHVFFAHQRLERPHTAADIKANEHSAEVKDIDRLMGHNSFRISICAAKYFAL